MYTHIHTHAQFEARCPVRCISSASTWELPAPRGLEELRKFGHQLAEVYGRDIDLSEDKYEAPVGVKVQPAKKG